MDAIERGTLVASIVARVADYREGEIPRIAAANVLNWWEQFDAADRPTILRETNRLLQKTYISRVTAKEFVSNIAVGRKLVGDDPAAFWGSVGFLRIQQKGVSQLDELTLLGEVLQERFGLGTNVEESPTNTYIYLDDISCSGNRVRYDLQNWMNQRDIRDATVHVIASVVYSNGVRYARRQLRALMAERNCTLHFWAATTLENRLEHASDAQVFWPTHLPDDAYVNAWSATFNGQPHFRPRPPGGASSTALFSSEQERETIEQAFLKKGAYIYSLLIQTLR